VSRPSQNAVTKELNAVDERNHVHRSTFTTATLRATYPPRSTTVVRRLQRLSRRSKTMLLEYVQAALRHAKYEILPDDGSYYGEIPECNGVYANANTLEDCREQLRQVLEEWVLFRVHRKLSLPIIDGLELTIKEVA